MVFLMRRNYNMNPPLAQLFFFIIEADDGNIRALRILRLRLQLVIMTVTKPPKLLDPQPLVAQPVLDTLQE
jgi:hypothetical protein